MYDILNSDEYTETEGRRYLNPQIALSESNQFIDNLRTTQQANNQQIQMDTYNLGTDISSNLGGLTSPVTDGNGGAGMSYFTSRYQTPQTASAVADLRSTAQATALNQALQNEQEMWKKRYNDAYRAYQKRSWDKSTAGGGGGDSGDSGEETELSVDVNSGDNGVGTVNENTKTGPGIYTPVTNYVGDYLSADGKQWWQLGSLMQGDEINFLGNSLTQPVNEEMRESKGITYMYLKNDQFPNGQWFRATRSAGPGTYSPYAGGD